MKCFRVIRIELNQTHCSYYTEIDSVMLIGCLKRHIGYKKDLAAAIKDLCSDSEESPPNEECEPYCSECGGVTDSNK